jgi:hypothetical protein
MLLALVFVAGGAAGFRLGRASRPTGNPTNPMEPHAFVRRLDKELTLDAAQRDSIVAILTRRQEAIDSAWRALRPSVYATMDSTRKEIVKVLRPNQRPRYLELFRAAHAGMAPK